MDFGAIVYAILAIIPKITYVLATSFLGLIDTLQMLVRKFAGLDVYFINNQGVASGNIESAVGTQTGVAQSGDIVYGFIRGILMGDYPALTNVFIGLIILGVILLVLTTIIALIRNEYNYNKENSPGKIVGTTIKSAFMFAIIPIVVLFGVYLANVVLVAVDRATSYSSASSTVLKTDKLSPYHVTYSTDTTFTETTAKSYTSYVGYNLFGNIGQTDNKEFYGTTTTTFSGAIFKASAYSANRVRLDTGKEQSFYELLNSGEATNFDGLFTDSSGNPEIVANYIDVAFADAVYVKTAEYLNYDNEYIASLNSKTGNPFFLLQDEQKEFINRFDVELVWYYYDLWQYNIIVAFGAGIIMTTIFVNIIFGLGKRIVEMLGLFIMLPPLIGIMPLDGGKAYGDWRKNFISKTMMAYGAIAGMNIVFLILPLLNTISFFGITLIDRIISTIIMLIALLTVKDFIALVSGFVQGENAEAVGGKIAKDVGTTLAKAGMMAASAAAIPVGAGLKAAKLAGKGMKLAGSSIKKEVTAKKRWKKDTDAHNKKFDDQLINADDEYANAQKSINEADYTQQAMESLNPFELEQLTNREKKIAGGTRTLSDEDMKQKQESFIAERAAALKEKDLAKAKKDNEAKRQAIEDERKKAPDEYDYHVHGLYNKKTKENTGTFAKRGAKYSASEIAAPIKGGLSNVVDSGLSGLAGHDFIKSFNEAGGIEGMRVSVTGGNYKKHQKQKEAEAKAQERKMQAEANVAAEMLNMQEKMLKEAEIKKKFRDQGIEY